ncbi:MAG: YjbQ family protein [Candidatus Nanohaloarchaeota archaeon]|nr:YjbQ family protein [Candidatus Nanohaloarchaeota archaeon]
MKILVYELRAKYGWVAIDEDVERLLPSTGRGVVHLLSKGSTSSLILIEADPHLIEDLFDFLDKHIPFTNNYKHHLTWGDDNGASHLRATLLGQQLFVPFKDGKLLKGTWQNIVLINHDTHPRKREVFMTLCFEDS